ncbi:MAG: polysulfide reductase NrfD [Deltaproteobacteria bacterium]|nr:polysulfide reductase NrfD [Deltaproteobacteria bacterium]MCZ6624044.1 polysulfide reductase NrfD [Deltaproteobacteria bacterium]
MRYGFVIDQNRCIGCHACTVACKQEHNVPVGVNRTWVKYIEKGEFPGTSRHFAVLRCNHCDDAPCIEICPTVALFRRPDGIVDFDSERCIGCKSCMQACPYDALYIDPNSNTAAKCNFDAPRVELGLKPVCEVVCPTQAIISGDLDDPTSQVSRIVSRQKVSIRKPEKGTKPKLFYVDVDSDLLQPTMMEAQSTHFWAEKQPGEDLYALLRDTKDKSSPGAAREVYDVSHPQLWGRMIASYLWTKSVAAGVILVAAILLQMGYQGETLLLNLASPTLALVFLGITMLLLVFDLKRPERFYYLLTKPNLKSWLVLGGYILMLYGFLALLWLFFGLMRGSVPEILFWSSAILAVCSACYSAFLFLQAKGRDLWQSPLFFWHLLVQAVTAGSASLIVLGANLGTGPSLMDVLGKILAISIILSLAMILGEVWLTHGSEDVKRATDLLKKGPLRWNFWGLVIGIGVFLPLILLFWPGVSHAPIVLASIFALIGLWLFEDLWIKAGQAVPLS